MRRTVGFVALASTGLLTSAVALAPSAVGTTRPHLGLPAASAATAAPCKPKFSVVANQKLGDPGTVLEAALEDVVEVDKKHAYAVGVVETEDSILKTEAFGALVDEGNGTKWKLDKGFDASLPNDLLVAVDATSTTNVWAAGLTFGTESDSDAATKPAAVVVHKNAAGWHRVNVPHSADTFLLGAVTTSPKDVYVGGLTVSGTDDSSEVPVIFHYNGKTWKRTVFASITGEGVSSMTAAGKTIVASITNEAFGSDPNHPAEATVEYLDGKTWKSLAFKPKRGLSALSGSSIDDLWAASANKNDDPTDVVYHHTKSGWKHAKVPGAAVIGVSERNADPEGIWTAGEAANNVNLPSLDVIRSSGSTPATIETAGAKFGFGGIDAHVTNRVLAVGSSTDSDGTVRALVEQATC